MTIWRWKEGWAINKLITVLTQVHTLIQYIHRTSGGDLLELVAHWVIRNYYGTLNK